MKLVLQINERAINDPTRKLLEKGIGLTPPINEDFWLMRVPVSKDQAVVAFPKFTVIGIGFQKEAEDWNTNLPSNCDAEEIYKHIKVNKGKAPKRQDCIEAIQMLKDAVDKLKAAAPTASP